MTLQLPEVQKRADRPAPRPASSLKIEVRSTVSIWPAFSQPQCVRWNAQRWYGSHLASASASASLLAIGAINAPGKRPPVCSYFELTVLFQSTVDCRVLTGDRAGWLSVCADRHPTDLQPIPRLPCSTLFQLSTQPNSHSKAISSIRQEARLSAPDPRFWKQWKFPNQSQPTISLTSRLRTHCDARFSAFLPPAASQWSGGRLIYFIGWTDPTAVSGQAGIP